MWTQPWTFSASMGVGIKTTLENRYILLSVLWLWSRVSLFWKWCIHSLQHYSCFGWLQEENNRESKEADCESPSANRLSKGQWRMGRVSPLCHSALFLPQTLFGEGNTARETKDWFFIQSNWCSSALRWLSCWRERGYCHDNTGIAEDCAGSNEGPDEPEWLERE